MQPIPTSWNGYAFRSRLEARWAVFFDAIGVRWSYEPEGYVLTDGTHYLPDFVVWTPQGSPVVYEVKPAIGGDDSKIRKMLAQLLAEYEARGYKGTVPRGGLLRGDPVDAINSSSHAINMCPRCGEIGPQDVNLQFRNNEDAAVGCWACDAETPDGGGHPEEPGMFDLAVEPYKGHVIAPRYSAFWRRVRAASLKARGARFEFGRSPKRVSA